MVGIDRLLNVLAAYRRTKTATIVIDFGTAITVDVVSKKGEFLGGLILPGIRDKCLCTESTNCTFAGSRDKTAQKNYRKKILKMPSNLESITELSVPLTT